MNSPLVREDKDIIDALAAADREKILAALAASRAPELDGPIDRARRVLIAGSHDDPSYPFGTDAQKFLSRALSASVLEDQESEIHRVGLSVLLRWNRSARLAVLDGEVDESVVAPLLGLAEPLL